MRLVPAGLGTLILTVDTNLRRCCRLTLTLVIDAHPSPNLNPNPNPNPNLLKAGQALVRDEIKQHIHNLLCLKQGAGQKYRYHVICVISHDYGVLVKRMVRTTGQDYREGLYDDFYGMCKGAGQTCGMKRSEITRK